MLHYMLPQHIAPVNVSNDTDTLTCIIYHMV